MTPELLRALVPFGVPGLALIVFLFLKWRFKFTFSTIPPILSGIIAIIFLVGLYFITYVGMTRFMPPTSPPVVSHSGELQNLVKQLSKSPTSNYTVLLAGTAEDQTALGHLFVKASNAPDYPTLLTKICTDSANARCIKCEQAENQTTITKTGEIAPVCKDEGSTVYCCA